jgi:crotonobetainyl-CoA:carnitine CoA-transferase CaiB-like acyl-CoA transferase
MSERPQERGPALAGLRVIDMSRVLAGPTCAQILADLGADVIKVERPRVGDDTRPWGPPWLPDANGEPTQDSTYFSSANRNKRSIVLDLGNASGAAVTRRLAAHADVLIENYKAGDLARRGLDHEALCRLNPRLIYCSITGFGQTGPLRDKPGYDYIFQAVGGLMSLTGHPDGAPGGGPMKIGASVVDQSTGLYACIAILAALQERNRSGLGQYIDMALIDAAATLGAHQASNFFQSGRLPQRMGNSSAGIMVPYETFECADGHLVVACGNDRQWRDLCAALDRPDLATHPDFASPSARSTNRLRILEELRPCFAARDVEALQGRLDAAGVPNGRINNVKQLYEMPQVQHRGIRISAPRSDGVRVDGVASPVRLTATPPRYRTAAPRLGEHTADILSSWLGSDAAAIERLRDEGAFGA